MPYPTDMDIDAELENLRPAQVFLLYSIKKIDELIAAVTFNACRPETYVKTFFKMVENNKKDSA